MTMKPSEMQVWLGIGALLLAAGIWLGQLNQRVSHLEANELYLHGKVNPQ